MGKDEDKEEAKPEHQDAEETVRLSLRISIWRMMRKTIHEDDIWVRMRIRTRLNQRISMWRMMRKMMRMIHG